jgi:hypothetical protein
LVCGSEALARWVFGRSPGMVCLLLSLLVLALSATDAP